MNSPCIDLKLFLEQFNSHRVAGIVTNTSGFIVEVNQAAADLLDSEIPHLKYKKFRTFFADRKNSIQRFEGARVQMELIDRLDTANLVMRTQPIAGKRKVIRTNMSCEVIGRGGRIVLIYWKFVDADLDAHTFNTKHDSNDVIRVDDHAAE